MALPAILAGISIASSVFGFGAAQDEAEANREANQLKQKRAKISNVLARRKALAQVRRKEASRVALSVATGQQGGSGASATKTSLQTQSATSIANQQQLEDFDQGITGFGQDASNSRADQSKFNTISNLANSISSFTATPTAEVGPLTADDLKVS